MKTIGLQNWWFAYNFINTNVNIYIMRIRITIAIFISQFLSLSSICQTSVKCINKILSDSYRRLQNSEDNIRYDSGF